MSELMASKMFPPYTGTKLIKRTRLLELLSRAKQRGATILAAPAGYGKTVLAMQLAETSKKPLVWYQLDDYDNDPAVFLQYIIAGVRQHYPEFGTAALHLIARPGLASHLRLIVMTIVNSLDKLAKDGLTIVLDDFHLVAEPIIHTFVQELLQNLPAGIHIIIASRMSLPISLSRLKVEGKVHFVGPEELRFTSQETAAFLKQNCKEVSNEILDILESRTAGWPAVLRLIGNSVSNITGDLINDSEQELYDYLTVEVFNQQPENVRSFLLATSILEELTPAFANRLLERTDSDQILDFLEKQHLFLIPLGGEKRAYRYHQLFRDFLRNRLGPARNGLLRRAALLSRDAGELESAVEYLVAGDAHEDLVVLIKEAGNQAFARGHWQTVTRWLEPLSVEALASDPWLALYKAKIEAFRGRLDETETWISIMSALFIKTGEQAGLLESQLLQARILRCRGRYEESIGLLDQVIKRVPGKESALVFELALEKSGCLFMSGQLDEAETVLAVALETAKGSDDKHTVSCLLEGLGHVYCAQGKYVQSLQMYQKAADISPERRLPSYYMQDAVSIIYHDWGEWELALEYAKRNVELKEKLNLTEALPSAYLQLAGIYSDQEQWELAEKYFHAAIDLIRKNNGERYHLALNLIFLAEGLSLQGRWTEARIKAEEALAEARRQAGLALVICQTAGSMVFLLAGDNREGKELLSAAINGLERVGLKKGLCYAYAFQAWFYLNEGDDAAARKYAEKAFELIAQLDFQQIFLGRYKLLRPLLKMGLEIGNEVTFIQRIMVRLGEPALTLLTDLVSHVSPEVRQRIITPLAEIGGPWAEKNILMLTNDQDSEVRKKARVVAQRLGLIANTENHGHNPEHISLHIATLGPFQAFWKGTEDRMINWRTYKTRDLLAYFVHHQQPVSKEKILRDLWPDIEPESAAAILHTTLYYLRRNLGKNGGKELILYNGKRYQLQPEIFTEQRQQFQEALAAGLSKDAIPERAVSYLEQAVNLYLGEYLEDIDYPWVIPYREHLKHSYIDARLRLARYYLETQDYPRAISHLQIVEECDPFMEEVHGLLMTAYASQDNRPAVEKQYQKMASVLKRELGLLPSRSLHDLYLKLLK